MTYFCVIVSPSMSPFTFGEKAVNAGQLVQQNCAVTEGDEPLHITWTLNGVNASNTLGIYVLKIGSRTSILTIESVRAYHGGNYTCTATNLAGSTHFTAYLAVNGIMFDNLLFPCFSVSVLFTINPFCPKNIIGILCHLSRSVQNRHEV